MHTRLVLMITLLAIAVAVPASAEQPTSSKVPSVQKASLNRAISRDGQQRATFSRRPARVGDRVEQELAMEMRMATTLRQGNQIGEKSRSAARNEQQRVVTTTHVEGDRAVAVRVQYPRATKQLTTTKDAEPDAETAEDAAEVAQPVAGKTYLCQRQPGQNGKLEITDAAGQIPPTDEYEIVAQHMEMVGRPNPLAEFLAGQIIAVGQTVELPKEVAGKVFNLGEQFGEVAQFTLKLEKLESPGERTQAVFLAHVEATSSNASQMRLELEGPLVVEADTCRVVKVNLTGPIAMSEMRGSYSTSYQVIGTGQLKMHIASTYRDVHR